ncbi:MAG TPA: helix-hairpin-helix domain-containing protein [Candidatus Dormibacteraeota bacterium]|nr:helix-hairpin-helix domain-containing protein [Candidatus Dormibacteraeota bacterium]
MRQTFSPIGCPDTACRPTFSAEFWAWLKKAHKSEELGAAGPRAQHQAGAPHDSRVVAQLRNLQRQAGNEATTMLLTSSTAHKLATQLLGPVQRKHASKGVVEMEPEVIKVPKARRDVLRLEGGEAESAIGKELDRYAAAVKEGHHLGLDNFEVWFRNREKAKEESSPYLALALLHAVFSFGLDVVFPEEKLFIMFMKKLAEKTFEKTTDHLAEPKQGDVEGFLANVKLAEETDAAHLLDVHDKFMTDNPGALDQAKIAFAEARRAGWEHTERLPPNVLESLHQLGIGLHGSAAATVYAERWLTAHIEGLLREDESVMQGTGGGTGVSTMAEIEALRQMERSSGADHRERIFELEKNLNAYFRTMVDINDAGAEWMHVKLGLDRDDAQAIVESREKDGYFREPRELLSRKLLSESEYKKIRRRLVAH